MRLPDTVTIPQAAALLRQLEAEVPAAGMLRIDAGALNVFDTSAVALLLAARRLAEQRGLSFEVAAAPPKLRALADLYGVEGLLSLSSDAAPERSAAT